MLKSKIESLLFISAKPMSVKQLADLLKKDSKEIEQAGDELVEIHKKEKGGIQIIKNGKKFQMVSSPENAKIVQEFIKDETTGELTRPSLEALTVIAYRGPISKLDLERIRGVNCSLILRNLLIRGLIEQKSNKTTKENYYNVTFDFLRFLGVNDVSELPDYEKLHEHDSLEKILNEGKEETNIEKEENEKEKQTISSDVESSDKDNTESDVNSYTKPDQTSQVGDAQEDEDDSSQAEDSEGSEDLDADDIEEDGDITDEVEDENK